MKTWEIERLFNDDIRDKRKTGSGVFHRRGKGVKHGISGALRTPSYYMSNKEKKKLNGEVKVTRMYDTIIPIDEFRLKDEETQKHMLIRWREIYNNTQIKTGLGIANSPYYKLVDELDLPKKIRGVKKGGKKAPRKSKPIIVSPELDLFELPEEPKEKEIEQETPKPILLTKGLHLEYNGTYDVEALSKIFTKLQLIVDGDTNKYNISLSLSEIVGD